MARTEFGGFEGGSLSFDTAVTPLGPTLNGSPTLETTIVRTGHGSLKISPTSGVAQNWDGGANLGTTSRVRIYVRVTARPATTARSILGAASGIHVSLNPNGTLSLLNGASLVGTSTTALTDTTNWYRIEYDGSVTPTLYIEGNAEVTGGSASGIRALFGCNDTVADTFTAYYDDWAFDTAALPGPGSTVLLVPISDNSVGASWTLGTGTAISSNGFGSLDNTPPTGVADLAAGSDPKQIRNAGANTNYVANMATYGSAIPAYATILSTRGVAFVGAPVTTSAKTGSLQITSNPAQGAATAFQNNTAQYWTGTAAGVWPLNWKRVATTIDASPTVVAGTSPVLSLNITGGTTTRIAMCCFLGIYVEFLVGAAAPIQSPTNTRGRMIGQAVNRASAF